MTKKDPRMMTDEEKLEGLANSGRMHQDKPAPAATEDDPDKKDQNPTPPTPPVKDDEPEDEPQTPEAPKTPEGDKKPENEPKTEGKTPSPSTDTNEQGKKRQVRYIPIDKYQDDKKKWETTEQALAEANARIAELENGNRPAGAQKKDKEAIIKNFAERYAMEEDDVKELLSLQDAGESIPPELVETMQVMQREKADREEAEYFNKEWTPIENKLRAKYPGATPEQLKQARDTIDKLAHTEAFIDKELGYVVYQNDTDISKIFTTEANPNDNKTPNPDPAPRRSVESSRPAGSKSTLTAADFRDKTDFSEFTAMEQSEVKSIIKDMDPKTYRNYIAWETQRTNNGGLTVTRNGQKVVLK